MKRIPRPSPAMIVALIGVVIGLGGVAFATIPDSSGTIHGCYNNAGNLRVVESAANCRKNETSLAWNQQGPPAPPGSNGVVVARARSTQAVTAPQSPNTVDVPLTGNTWVQQPSESDFLYGSITFTHPGGCNEVAGQRIDVLLDGELFMVLGPSAPNAGAGTFTQNFALDVRNFLFEPGQATPHRLTLRAATTFVGACLDAGATTTVDSIQINVLGFQ